MRKWGKFVLTLPPCWENSQLFFFRMNPSLSRFNFRNCLSFNSIRVYLLLMPVEVVTLQLFYFIFEQSECLPWIWIENLCFVWLVMNRVILYAGFLVHWRSGVVQSAVYQSLSPHSHKKVDVNILYLFNQWKPSLTLMDISDWSKSGARNTKMVPLCK